MIDSLPLKILRSMRTSLFLQGPGYPRRFNLKKVTEGGAESKEVNIIKIDKADDKDPAIKILREGHGKLSKVVCMAWGESYFRCSILADNVENHIV